MSVEEFTYLRGRATRPVKVTLISAQQAAAYYDPDKSRGAYATRDAYLADLVDFTRREIAELIRLGLQVHPDRRAAVRGAARRDDSRRLPPARQRPGQDARRLHRAGQRDHRRPPGRRHLRHPYLPRQPQEHVLRAGGYDRIAQQVFGRSRFDRFLLEYDDARSGNVRAAAARAGGPIVVLGLVSSKKPRDESWMSCGADRGGVAIVPLDRLALSPQCGFASTHEGNTLTEDDQRKKLELVARTAKAVWG